jgi:hypothetical protein
MTAVACARFQDNTRRISLLGLPLSRNVYVSIIIAIATEDADRPHALGSTQLRGDV